MTVSVSIADDKHVSSPLRCTAGLDYSGVEVVQISEVGVGISGSRAAHLADEDTTRLIIALLPQAMLE